MEAEMKCGNCEYYGKPKSDGKKGICVRYPPIPIGETYRKKSLDASLILSQVKAYFPEVLEAWVCGKYSERGW